MELLAWYNLVFVAPIGLAGVYLILSATGLGGHDVDADTDADLDLDHDVDVDLDHDVDLDLDHDVDLDLDHDVDLDLDHDVDLDLDHDVDLDLDHDVDVDLDHDVDVDMDHDVDVDADHDIDLDQDVDVDHGVDAEHHVAPEGIEHESYHSHVSAHSEHSLVIRALSVLGVGRVPVSILLTTLMVLFGAIGLVCNSLFESVLPWEWAPNIYVWPSMGVACFLSLVLTSKFARLMYRVMPTSETYAVKPVDLVGRIGTAVYELKEGEKGVVDVKDEGGTWQRIAGQCTEGRIGKDEDVIIVRYHREHDYYDVSRSPL